MKVAHRTLELCRRGLMALLLALTFTLASTPATPARAEITTVEILTDTIGAMPSCLRYQVKGMCFFLKCGLFGCYITSSIRISHFVPDAIVSTYNDPLMHPWTEVGKPLSTVTSILGSAMMGMPVDASASTARETKEITTFKSADAIGNPAGMILPLLTSGQFPALPDLFAMPGLGELMEFPAKELPRIQQQWMRTPVDIGNKLLSGAKALALAPQELIGKLLSIPGYLSKLQSAIGNVGEIMRNGIPLAGLVSGAADAVGIDLGPLQSVAQLAGVATGGMPLGSLFCPGSASAFSLHYLSDVDSYIWRDVIPVEMLYRDSWLPMFNEVSQQPQLFTWGNRYPRTGMIVQSHPVKASAVLAERVASIITQKAQPHVYTPLRPGSGYKYFEQFSDRQWQMLSPSKTGCIDFGTNDTLSLTSFGDFKTDSADGYVWNMWNKYDCCQSRGSFLFSIP